MKKILISIIAFTIIFSGCSDNKKDDQTLNNEMNKIAVEYVKTVLLIGQYDPSYVDAYYGPDSLKPKTIDTSTTQLASLDKKINSLLDQLELFKDYDANELSILRYRFLFKQLLSAQAKVMMLRGAEFTFKEEAKHLYDIELKDNKVEYENILNELNSLLPGTGSVQSKFEKFRTQFIIPESKLDTVFKTAIEECKKRTKKYIDLPEGEKFVVEYVSGKPWAGYNWYKGNYYSVIQVNTGLPIYADRVIDLAAHEGYPGHHVYNSLLEQKLVKEKSWIEFTVYPLTSPQSLIAEGTANYGVDAAFPFAERVKYEQDVIFPLAGLDASKTETYYKVMELVSKLSFAGNNAAEAYLDKKASKEETIKSLMKFSLLSEEKANQRIKFLDAYRSYIINYNVGHDLIKEYIVRNGGTDKNEKLRWELFEKIISTPQTPSGLLRSFNAKK